MRCLALCFVVGCTETEPTCDTGEQIVLTGSAQLVADIAVTIPRAGEVAGITGAPEAERFYIFDVRDSGDDIGEVGDVDVASVPMRYLEGSVHADCTIARQCSGFFASRTNSATRQRWSERSEDAMTS